MLAEENLSKLLYKIELYLIKIIPIIIAFIYLLNTILSYFYIDLPILSYAKHVQSHICKYYNVPEDGEQAACLIGYIEQKMHRVFKNMISTGTR